jgi:predicted alpha/beta superfamily hydrolase
MSQTVAGPAVRADLLVRPAPCVIKIPNFKGRLSGRPLYIYLPPGYDDQPDRHYPVLYMHDGQNCFQAYVADSFVGSWRADETADRLISQGLMRPCIMVGVGHGGAERVLEYLPPYAMLRPRLGKYTIPWPRSRHGRSDETFAYYLDDVAPYVRQNYRLLEGRQNVATCGSSMGGVFSTYIAWEHPEFARHHAILSPSYWSTCTWRRVMEMVERLRHDQPRDVRLWLDSGTLDTPGRGDDGMADTQAARDALLANGYELGPDFQYHLDEGGIHSESSWSARLHLILPFLFPPESTPQNG